MSNIILMLCHLMSVSQVVGDSVKKEFAFKVCKFGPTSFFFNFFRSQTHQQNEVFVVIVDVS